jgi:D-alanyl-D-alanine carboxypeptidase (penicillin-binding protein 5/6)
LLLAVCGFHVYESLEAPLPTSSIVATTNAALTQPAAQPIWPNYGSGAVGAVGFNNILTAHGAQTAVPIASITKIITALVVLQAKPLAADDDGPSITLTNADQEIYDQEVDAGAEVAPVVPGVALTERQMLEAMLVPSAANYSVTLADWAYGSVGTYTQAANAWLASHGLNSTSVVDTSGLSSSDVSIPADLVTLGKLALANPALAQVVAIQAITLPAAGALTNTNELLGTNGVTGIKTGTTSAAGACLLFSAVIPVGTQNVTVVGVLLGGETHPQIDADITSLLASITPDFHSLKLATTNQVFGTYTTAWGQTANIETTKDAATVVWSNTPVSLKVQADAITSATNGQQHGQLVAVVGTDTQQIPLYVQGTIQPPTIWWRLLHLGWPFSNFKLI